MPSMDASERRARLLVGEDDPFADAPAEAGDVFFEAAIPPDVVASHPNRWVVLRHTEDGHAVVNAADDLRQLLDGFELGEGDVTVFVRDPSAKYG